MAGAKNSLVTGYLLGYNAALTVGWAYILYLTAGKFSELPQMWTAVEWPLKICQTAAIMEVVHAFLRIVPSNVFLTFFQVSSRVFALWGVLNLSPPSQVGIGLPMLLFAWCVTEIIRYGYYVLHLVGLSSLIQWFRYTLFIVLYPIGVTGELLSIYVALAYVQEKKLYSLPLPNPINFGFDYYYLLIIVMLTYIPVFPQLYLHMFAQRRKILGGGAGKKVK